MDGWLTTLATSGERLLAWSLARKMLGQGENRFARFVTWVSFIGLALGVMVLTVVITVMNGFDRELKSRLLQAIPHITIQDAVVGGSIHRQAVQLEGVIGTHNYFQGLGALSVAAKVQPVTVYGVDDQGLAALDYLAERTVRGNIDALRDNPVGMLLGEPLARYLGLQVGDGLVLLAVENNNESVAPRILRFTLVGTFELGAEPDYSLAVVNLQRMTASSWHRLGDYGLQLQLLDPMQAPGLVKQLQAFVPAAQIDSWDSAYGELFSAVALEKSMMFVLLLLVVAIASFNIIAGQTMMVNDKRASIAILRTMGGRSTLIRDVFLLQGVAIGLTGTVLGLALGLACASVINEIVGMVQQLTGLHLLDGSFFVEVPVEILPLDLLLIAVLTCTLCLLSAWIPARRAALLDPIQGLH